MKKTFLLMGLNCPNCSAKIEKEVGELAGVSFSVVNLLKQTLTIDVTETFAETVEKEIARIVHNHEPQVEVSEYIAKDTATNSKDGGKKTIIRLILGTAFFLIGIIFGEFAQLRVPLEMAFFITAYVILGADVVLKAVKNIARGRVFDENFLMSISTMGAFIIGEYHEAIAVMLFYQIGEFFQDLSVGRSRRSIAALMDIRPDFARVKRNGNLVNAAPDAVLVGEEIVIKPGEKIALDGIITHGESMLDMKALTGESVPKAVCRGDEVLSGSINQSGVLSVKVTKSLSESTVTKIIDLVENASSRKAPAENFITAFARYYTPIVVILAVLFALVPPLTMGGEWTEWIRRAMVLLVISCPCALVISIPLTFFGGIGAASRRGVLVKGSNYLEALNNVKTAVFDKTGTLTKGVFKVSDIVSENGFTNEQILEYAAFAESFSNHPIAKSILTAYKKEIDKERISEYKERFGYGVSAVISGKTVLAGNTKLMEDENVSYIACNKLGTKVYVAIDGQYAGCIIISDEIKADSKKAIYDLKRLGVQKTVMLTGDDEEIAKTVVDELDIDEYYSELLPHEKVEKLELIDGKKGPESKLAFVGDGINDAPVLARADIGSAMGALGSDAAIEASDVVIMTDEPSKLVEAITVAKATRRIVIQNVVITLAVKGVFLVLGAFGAVGMWEAVFGDVGVAMLAIFNAMRIVKK